MVTIQADEHIPYAVVKGLRSRGVEIYSLDEEDLKGILDEPLLQFCLEQGRILLTNDTDFIELTKSRKHAGIIYLTEQLTPIGEIIRSVLLILNRHANEEFPNSIFYIPGL